MELFGLRLFIASAEDVVLAKLEWAKVGQPQRQIEDAAGILRVRGGEMDQGYLEGWVQALGLQEEWARAQTLAAG